MSPPPDPPLDGALLDELWDFGDPASSERRMRAQLQTMPTATTAHRELRTQLARALGLQQLFDAAATELDEAEAAGPDVPIVRTRTALERGRLHNTAGRPAQAVPEFEAAVATARSAGNEFLLIDALHMLAIADPEHNDRWTLEALTATDAATDARAKRWAGSLHNNFGWTLHDRGDPAGALREFEAAREAYQRSGTTEQIRVAHWAVARALRSLGRYDEARVIQNELIQGEQDGYVSEELAELLLVTGRADEARPHFARAAELLAADPWFDEPERLARLRELGAHQG